MSPPGWRIVWWHWRLAYRHGVRLDFIRLGRPVENGFIESFKGSYTMNV
jgi:transposase InsO family protein